MTKTYVLILLALTLVVSSCMPYTMHKPVEPDTITIAAAESSWRFAYIRPGKDGFAKFCAEPPPDTATENTSEIVSKLDLGSVFAQQTAVPGSASLDSTIKLSEKIIELADRTQVVEVQRHALYRLCELHANGAITQSQVDKLYDRLLFTIRLFALSDLATNLNQDSGVDNETLVLLITLGLTDDPRSTNTALELIAKKLNE